MLFVILLWLAVSASSQSLRPELTLAQAVDEAREHHPEAIVAAARVRVAEARRVQAALRPNPQLTLQTENARFWGQPAFSFARDTDDFAFLTWTVEAGGKRGFRIAEAEEGILFARADQQRMLRTVASRVIAAYWSAVAAATQRDLLRETERTFEGVVEYHRTRLAEGAVAEVDLMRVMLEQDRIAVSAATADAQAQVASVALLRELGRADMTPPVLSDKLEIPPPVLRPAADVWLTRRPDVLAARRLVAQARSRLRLQQAIRVPDPQPLFGYKRSNGFDTIIAGLQLDLPFYHRNQGEIAAAAADISGTEAALRLTENAARADVEAAWIAYQARRTLLEGRLTPMRERADEISRIAMSAYREGGIDLLRLLDAQRARLEAITSWYLALADYRISASALQIATGESLP